jgi:hypothetical protein
LTELLFTGNSMRTWLLSFGGTSRIERELFLGSLS